MRPNLRALGLLSLKTIGALLVSLELLYEEGLFLLESFLDLLQRQVLNRLVQWLRPDLNLLVHEVR